MTEHEKREKVIKGLECHMAILACDKCPYYCGDTCSGIDGVVYDALALLKAQEPVEPVFDAGDGKTIGQFLCGKCHAKIGFGHPHFCWYCGRRVKWE